MKKTGILAIFFFMAFIRCSDMTADLQLDDLKEHNMKIIPENPVSGDDIKLVVFEDCQYNKLVQNKRTGKTITIEKQFNSSMKLPCVEKNDTISIGKLPAGTYTLNYQLTDLAANVSNPVALSVSVTLTVSK